MESSPRSGTCARSAFPAAWCAPRSRFERLPTSPWSFWSAAGPPSRVRSCAACPKASPSSGANTLPGSCNCSPTGRRRRRPPHCCLPGLRSKRSPVTSPCSGMRPSRFRADILRSTWDADPRSRLFARALVVLVVDGPRRRGDPLQLGAQRLEHGIVESLLQPAGEFLLAEMSAALAFADLMRHASALIGVPMNVFPLAVHRAKHLRDTQLHLHLLAIQARGRLLEAAPEGDRPGVRRLQNLQLAGSAGGKRFRIGAVARGDPPPLH